MEDERDAIDTLIDDTARELTAGTPSTALREGVRARLSGGLKASGYRWRRAWSPMPIWQPALGAAAVAVLAVLLMLRGDPPSTPPGPVAPPASVAGGLQASGMNQPSGTEPPIVVAEGPPASTERSGRVGRRLSSAPVGGGLQPFESNQVAVPPNPLPPIELLEVEPVPLDVAVIEQIPDPMPLCIDSLEIERLSLE